MFNYCFLMKILGKKKTKFLTVLKKIKKQILKFKTYILTKNNQNV